MNVICKKVMLWQREDFSMIVNVAWWWFRSHIIDYSKTTAVIEFKDGPEISSHVWYIVGSHTVIIWEKEMPMPYRMWSAKDQQY